MSIFLGALDTLNTWVCSILYAWLQCSGTLCKTLNYKGMIALWNCRNVPYVHPSVGWFMTCTGMWHAKYDLYMKLPYKSSQISTFVSYRYPAHYCIAYLRHMYVSKARLARLLLCLPYFYYPKRIYSMIFCRIFTKQTNYFHFYQVEKTYFFSFSYEKFFSLKCIRWQFFFLYCNEKRFLSSGESDICLVSLLSIFFFTRERERESG